MLSVEAGQPQKGERARVHRSQLLSAVKFTETESRMVGAGAGGGERRATAQGARVRAWEDDTS